ncbi:MAG: hypothetical protein HY360_04510 [Verrucomicrobia bacterium]|nr:hypothetical protein [Verrucomicrobiota bacterium]
MKNLHSGFGEHTRLACSAWRLDRRILSKEKIGHHLWVASGTPISASRLEGDRRLPPLTAVETHALPIPLSVFYRTVVILVLSAAVAHAGELISDVRPLSLTPIEKAALENKSGKLFDNPLTFTPYNVQRPREPKRVEIFGDRKVYWADDTVGQFLVSFIGQDIATPGVKLLIEVAQDASGDDAKVIGGKEISPVAMPKVALLVDTGSLAPGAYRLRAKLVGGNSYRTIPDYAFQKIAKRHEKVAVPAGGIPLLVGVQTNLATTVWPITAGIPLPREAANSTTQLVLLENGKPVPAQFSIRSTWYPNQQIKWLGLDFLARYENGKPLDYRLQVLPEDKATASPATALKVEENPDFFTVDTGKLRFKVNRKKFTGIEEASLAGQPFIRGEGGPFLVDEKGDLFEASQDPSPSITVEESGPVRVTIYATGWYVSAKTKEKLCIFKTRISAFAGQPFLNITHSTILTYDTEKKKLADVGFDVKTVDAAKWQMGADGKTLAGDLPAGQSAVSLHQERWNHFRLLKDDQVTGEGKQSDGWATEILKSGSLTVMLRNIWQLYPKELELSRAAMTLHFWPKHGAIAFTEAEEMTPEGLYKIYYAHQGKFMDLKFPKKYFDAIRQWGPLMERQDQNALEANGQGMAISSDFSLYFKSGTETQGIAEQAALFQEGPHAIAQPEWNAKTGVEGHLSAVDKKRFPLVEKSIDEGYRSNTTTPAILEEYGLWIWPDTHNNWDPQSKLPEWHRFWNNSHYQNVSESWLIYLRSGYRWAYEWGRDNTRHFMDVGTVNYDNPVEPLLGHIAGAMYHDKGFLPWGSACNGTPKGDDWVEIGGHFIDSDAFIMSYFLLGDQRGRELMETWGQAFHRAATPPERSRDACVTLGCLINYYTTTWDPQALLYISDLSNDMLCRPWREIPAKETHPIFHKQWPRRYWELTGDERLKQRVLEYIADVKQGHLHLHALAYEWTGDKKYLTDLMPSLSTWWQHYYFNTEDSLDGFGPRLGELGSNGIVQKIPYYLQALLDAGIESLPTDEKNAVPPPKPVSIPKKAESAFSNGKDYPYGPMFGFLQPKGAEPVVQLEVVPTLALGGYGFGPPRKPLNPSPFYVRVEDADGKILLEQSYLHASKRPAASIALDARKQKAPWKLYKNGGFVNIKWDGPAEALFMAATPAEAQKEAAAAKP